MLPNRVFDRASQSFAAQKLNRDRAVHDARQTVLVQASAGQGHPGGNAVVRLEAVLRNEVESAGGAIWSSINSCGLESYPDLEADVKAALDSILPNCDAVYNAVSEIGRALQWSDAVVAGIQGQLRTIEASARQQRLASLGHLCEQLATKKRESRKVFVDRILVASLGGLFGAVFTEVATLIDERAKHSDSATPSPTSLSTPTPTRALTPTPKALPRPTKH
jgi:hypothetical protein